MAVKSSGRELTFPRWLAKITERQTFILLNIKEKRDISEDDYALLRALHRLWFMGDYPVYTHELLNATKPSEITQTGLFDNNFLNDVTDLQGEDDGTEVDKVAVVTKTQKNDDTIKKKNLD